MLRNLFISSKSFSKCSRYFSKRADMEEFKIHFKYFNNIFNNYLYLLLLEWGKWNIYEFLKIILRELLEACNSNRDLVHIHWYLGVSSVDNQWTAFKNIGLRTTTESHERENWKNRNKLEWEDRCKIREIRWEIWENRRENREVKGRSHSYFDWEFPQV